MTEQEVLLVVGLASLALAITLGDLLLSLVRHRRRAALLRAPSPAAGAGPGEEAEAAARRESIRRRLAAIEAGSGQATSPRGRA